MKKAILFSRLNNNLVRCDACEHHCVIAEGKTGICGVRKNKKGELYLSVYGKAAAVNLDPIEKKPLFHFYPGSVAFSLGTVGCNFGCKFCQNWDISQKPKIQDSNENAVSFGEDWPPEKIVDFCIQKHIPIIAYTYNEPTIWTEYAVDIMRLAREKNIKNVWVSNGFMSEKTLELICPYLDAINIDLKSFSEGFYQQIVLGHLEPVKRNIKRIWQKGIWEEVTTLVIPGLNDSVEELEQIAKFLTAISSDIPWHISAFYPAYKMLNYPPTPQETLVQAYQIGKKAGLKYVYTGNIPDENWESTFCPHCGKKIIKRWGITLMENKLENGCCPYCGSKIVGRWGNINQ